jgi:glucose/arabinose dehydrogenase
MSPGNRREPVDQYNEAVERLNLVVGRRKRGATRKVGPSILHQGDQHMCRSAWIAAACLAFATSAAAQQVTNPIPTPIVKGSVRIRIDNLVQMPSTTSSLGNKRDNSPTARARINFLRESPDGRLFVNDLRGQLYTLDQNYQPQLYLDIDSANGGAGSIFPATYFSNGLAAGLITFNFHPDFQTNGIFYTIHMERAQDTLAVPNFATVDERSGSHPVKWETVVTEWKTPTPSASTWNAASGTRREILRVGTTADDYFHPYGDLQFNPLAKPGSPDYGLMYLSGGDWGYINGAGAPQGSGTEGQPDQLQRLNTLAGTLLRIDPRSPSQTGGQPGIGDYTIPSSNPFVDGNPNTLDEIYAFGFRNGHRMMWDTKDGSLYVTNVGHANLEEVERVVPGGNYGWPLREGTFVNGNDLAHGGDGDADHVFVNSVPNAQDVDSRGQPFLYPVAQYDHGEGASIAGGFVYHGHNVPQLYGKLIFGDIVTGRIFVADMPAIRNVDTTNPTTNVNVQEVQLYTVGANGVETNVNDLRTIVGNSRADLRYGIDSSGEIFVMTKTDGFIRKLVGVDALNELVLRVDPMTGQARIENKAASGATIKGYSILSSSNSLRPGDAFWHSLTDQGQGGWVEAGPDVNALSELNPMSQLSIPNGAGFNLGAPFNPAGSEDLKFEFQIIGNTGTTTGIVTYGSLLAGDFNRNGVVDAGDYVLWRKTNGQQVLRGVGADGNGDGMIDNSDYELWKSNLGNTLAAQASAATSSLGTNVAEPHSGLLILLTISRFAMMRRRKVLSSLTSQPFAQRIKISL